MCRHPELYRLQADIGSSELAVPGDLLAKGTRVLVSTRPGAQPQRGLAGWEEQGSSVAGQEESFGGPQVHMLGKDGMPSPVCPAAGG